jgi:hypothetical protein
MDQKIILSFINHDSNGIQSINKDQLKDYGNLYVINRRKLIDRLSLKENNKNKICKYCNQSFNKIFELKNHILVECFYNELQKIPPNYDNKNNNIIESKEVAKNDVINNNTNNNFTNTENNNSSTNSNKTTHNISDNTINNIVY